LEEIISEDISNDKHAGRILTRFPPEPNGYLHIGHAKSICLNFGLAQTFNGKTNLRFDDTNPITEKTEYVESIKADIRWLGFVWEAEYYASDYFEQLHDFAVKLITKGLAYVDDLSAEEIARLKGTPTEAGLPSPFRNRPIAENLELFAAMRNGIYADGEKTLRAKIDMASPNMHLRDPIMYRIKHAHHHRTGNKWCIYPMYDFAHGQSDAIEKITHSICTLEFEVHRPLYNWFIEQLEIFPSRQIEFARGNINYTITSKRKLLQLVTEGHVAGWDDPRMPTISGMRRRGYTPASIRDFCDRIGIARRENMIDVGLLEFCVREDLNKNAQRRMVVVNPIKLIIDNYPDDTTEMLTAENNTEDPNAGSRLMPFSKNLWIEADDFTENPPKKYFRLAPGLSVRLKSAYIITCTGCDKDENGNVIAVHANYHPNSKSGQDTSGISVKGVMHFVSAAQALPCTINLYERLFQVENPASEAADFLSYLNPDSLKVITNAFAEPVLADAQPLQTFQFLRLGYFCADTLSKPNQLIFNRTVTLKDTWAKEVKKSN
ncbi:MAG TPA: glutamine--tRNA ligase/YqeY domain fusion protein, partial [Bacteroidia bacterium]|nr:glutamine--tRNA ligase/YqeY domain fusion protein [Bacteroidia bacterium]